MHPRRVYDPLLDRAAATLSPFAADPKWVGGPGACTLVLHTWRQNLRRHLQVHALMTGGALGADAGIGAAWIAPKRQLRFLFPAHALSKVLQGKFLQALAQAQADSSLPRDPAAQRSQRRRALARQDWVVHAKTPLAGPAAVLDHLSRRTHRTAIGAERIVALPGEQALLRVRANVHGGSRVVAIDGVDFIGRFLHHVVPAGFKRVRHDGLLAPAAKAQRLAQARMLLAMPQASVQAAKDARTASATAAGLPNQPACAEPATDSTAAPCRLLRCGAETYTARTFRPQFATSVRRFSPTGFI